MRTARRVAGGVLLAGAGLLALVPVRAEATALTQAGWWWRANDGALPAAVPAPATVPEGGLMVAGAPDGATALAALHFDLADDETAPVLTLTVAESGDQGGDTAILAACLTGSAWQPANGGAWTNKPFPACSSGSVTGVRADDGATWTFALAPLLSDGILDVTLVPGVDPTLPAGANGSVFQLVFAAPTAASLATTTGAGPTTDFDLPDFTSPDLGVGGGSGGFDAPAQGGGLSLGPVDAAAGFSPALPQADQGLTATAPVVQQRNQPLDATPAALVEDHNGLGALVLVLCGAALLWSAQQPPPAPRRLGSFAVGPAEDAVAVAPVDAAGLGRFARVRTGPPPRL